MRFRYFDSDGTEVCLSSVDALRFRIQTGAVTPETLLHDAAVGQWAPARIHPVYRFIVEQDGEPPPDTFGNRDVGVLPSPDEKTSESAESAGGAARPSDDVSLSPDEVPGMPLDLAALGPLPEDRDPASVPSEEEDLLSLPGDPLPLSDSPPPKGADRTEEKADEDEPPMPNGPPLTLDPWAPPGEEPGSPGRGPAEPSPSGGEPAPVTAASSTLAARLPWTVPERQPVPEAEPSPALPRPASGGIPRRPRLLGLLLPGAAAVLLLGAAIVLHRGDADVGDLYVAALGDVGDLLSRGAALVERGSAAGGGDGGSAPEEPPPRPEGPGTGAAIMATASETTGAVRSESLGPAELEALAEDVSTAASGDLEEAMSDLRLALGVPEGPPSVWLQGGYLSGAHRYPEVRGYWVAFGTFVSSMEEVEEDLYRGFVRSRVLGMRLDTADAAALSAETLSRYESSSDQRRRAYGELSQLARLSVALHDTLSARSDDISFEPFDGRGLSRDPVIEAVADDPVLAEHIWSRLDQIFDLLEELQGLRPVSTSRLQAALLQQLREGPVPGI